MEKVTVCDSCLRASCWQGEFLCDDHRGAGTREMSIEQLEKLKLENSRYWYKYSQPSEQEV